MKNIALVAGGFSGEFEISIKSAQNIADELANSGYKIYTIIITKESWSHTSPKGDIIDVDKSDFSLTIDDKKVVFDAVFITIHGTPGEDGKLQAYFDLLNLPYNTCDAATSAITMNKAFSKAVVADIPNLFVAKSVQLFKTDLENAHNLLGHLKYPLFIKPNNGGSSVGMSKIKLETELQSALIKAFHEDEQVLVEEFIEGREFSQGIAALSSGLTVLPSTEIISSKDFFDYEAKYTPGVSQEITPANLTSSQKEKIDAIIAAVYKKLSCKGMVRIDYILEKNSGDFYFIEINTTPGQSAASLIPQQVRAAGINVGAFYSDLIEMSLR